MASEHDDEDEEGGRPSVPNYITPAGYKRLADEMTWLHTVERPRVVHGVSEAAAEGDRSENAEYIYGKRRLRQIDGRMRFLRRRLDAAVVVDPREKRGESEKVFFGATVVLEDEDGGQQEYKIVGEDEIETETRRISWRSPIGSKLIGRRVDDEVRVQTPSGLKVFTIVDVRYE